MLVYVWDEAKNQRNIKRHGIAFGDAVSFSQDDNRIERIDNREDYGEERIVSTGLVNGKIMVIVFTEAGSVIRIISARLATKREADDYFRQ
jgi:uncharacterized protein